MGFFFFIFDSRNLQVILWKTYRFGEMPKYLGAIMKYGSIP